MRLWIQAMVIACMAFGLSACGTKGKLKSPAQIEIQEQKKAEKKAKEEAKKKKDEETVKPETMEPQ